MRQMAMLVTVGAAFAVTAATAEAQLPKKGAYSAHFGYHCARRPIVISQIGRASCRERVSLNV